MHNPYSDLPIECFWRTGVAVDWQATLGLIYQKRFSIDQSCKIATAGSCFAQHITRELKSNSFGFLDLEPAPEELPPDLHQRYGYGIYSARYGNIYTAKQLLQLAREAFSLRPLRILPWKKNDQLIDALRPSIEPDGFSSVAELVAHREHHIACVRECFERMDLFVFTLGLTEAWCDSATGYVLPSAPGVNGGEYDASQVEFVNFSFFKILSAFERFLKILKDHRPEHQLPKILLTVSPVPLTATASGRHVLLATNESKAILRAVASELQRRYEYIDYFPSYEIINHPVGRRQFFDENLRTVSEIGVQTAMQCFLQHHKPPVEFKLKNGDLTGTQLEQLAQTLICEEELMDRKIDD